MVYVHLAYTAPINPPSASPTLTRTQVWAGLQRKIRHAEEFVPVIEACVVESEVPEEGEKGSGVVVTRRVKFEAGGKEIREVVRGYGDCVVVFEQPNGMQIRNIISDGPDGDLFMTYLFEYDEHDIEEGTVEYDDDVKRLKAIAKVAVEESIKTIREMVKDGRIRA